MYTCHKKAVKNDQTIFVHSYSTIRTISTCLDSKYSTILLYPDYYLRIQLCSWMLQTAVIIYLITSLQLNQLCQLDIQKLPAIRGSTSFSYLHPIHFLIKKKITNQECVEQPMNSYMPPNSTFWLISLLFIIQSRYQSTYSIKFEDSGS